MHKAVADKLMEEKSDRTKRPMPGDSSENDVKEAKIQPVLSKNSLGVNKPISQATAEDLVLIMSLMK
jgi:hypothetical protein